MADELEFTFDEPAPPALVLGKKKKKKKKKIAPAAPELDPSGDTGTGLLLADNDGDAKEKDGTVRAAPLGDEAEGDADVHADDHGGDVSVGVIDSAGTFAAFGAPEDGSDGRPEDAVDAALTAAPKAAGKRKKKVAAKPSVAPKPESEQDLDAILAELGDGPPPVEHGEPAAARQARTKKKAKKADTSAVNAGDDLDALLAELDVKSPTVAAAGGRPSAAAVAAEGDAARGTLDLDAMMAELGDGGGGESVAGAKKKKKRAKRGAGKDVDGGEEGGDQEDAAPGPTAKKGAKKESAAVKRLREQRERMAAEEARYALLKEEEEARLAEEERVEAEKGAVRERAKAARKEADKARKARLKAEGKLLSKAEAAKRRKAEAFKQQALASGLVAAVAPVAATEAAGEGKVVYAKKRRGKAKNEGGDAMSAAVAETRTAAGPDCGGPAAAELRVAGAEEEAAVPEEWDAEVSAEVREAGSLEAGGGTVAATGDGAARGGGDGEGTAAGGGEDGDGSSDDDSQSDSFDSEDFEGMSRADIAAQRRRHDVRKARAREAAEAKAARSPENLRSPVICILGHVDTGKTKILDRIRRTNVQDGEAGGITQQIGATYFPIEAVKKETLKLDEGKVCPYNVPSLLIIDTPGHESFTNLRSRGSSLCDIAILVIDIMHGLEPQTRESIDLLKLRKTPFVVALNKCDRMYDWQAVSGNNPFRDSLDRQKRHVVDEFHRRTKETQLELASVGFNTALYWENDDVRRAVSIVPTSAITGEGMPDLLLLITSLSQKLLTERLMFNPTLEATVLEVKVIEGLGTTIDIILTGGTIKEGDTIVVVGLDGPIEATIRALLTPHPMKEMRVRGQYHHHKQIRAAQGIKISADGMEKAVAGTQLLVAQDPSDEDEMAYLREEVMKDFATILQSVDKSGEGVYVQASTLGSLEALLEFLRTSEVPVSGINIGPVFKKDVTRASAMLEKRKEYATILAFDVPVEKDAREMAEDVGVTVFTADIIYNLFDMFTEHMANHKKARQEEVKDDVVFPCILKVLQEHVFNKKDPIILGVDVSEGVLRVGCPLAVRSGDAWLDIGRVVSMEVNTKPAVIARAGESVCVKIQSSKTAHVTYGRHFTWTDSLVSKMSREAIDLLKSDFRTDLGKVEWLLVIRLKKAFGII